MDNIVFLDDDFDNNVEVGTATAQIMDEHPTSNNQAKTEQNINTNQTKIMIMGSGDVKIVNPDGKSYLVGKEILEQEDIDINHLTGDSIQLLLNMTSPNEYYSHVPLDHSNHQQQQGHQNEKASSLGSSNGSTSSTDQLNRRKRLNKEIFDQSATVKAKRKRMVTNSKNSAIVGNKRTVKFVPYHATTAFSASVPVNSSLRPPVLAEHVIDLAKICQSAGTVIYKPDHHQPSNNSQNSLPPHCVYCHNPIPKSKLDYVLIRLPIHIDCNDDNDDAMIMPVLSSECQ